MRGMKFKDSGEWVRLVQRLWVIWGHCCLRVAACPCLPNGPITQLSPYLTQNHCTSLLRFEIKVANIFSSSKCIEKSRFSDDEIHCKGHRPSQFIWESAVCDGRIDCMDRSDEDGCSRSNYEAHDNLLVKTLLDSLIANLYIHPFQPIFKPLRRQPNITETDLRQSIPDSGEVPERSDCGEKVQT